MFVRCLFQKTSPKDTISPFQDSHLHSNRGAIEPPGGPWGEQKGKKDWVLLHFIFSVVKVGGHGLFKNNHTNISSPNPSKGPSSSEEPLLTEDDEEDEDVVSLVEDEEWMV